MDLTTEPIIGTTTFTNISNCNCSLIESADYRSIVLSFSTGLLVGAAIGAAITGVIVYYYFTKPKSWHKLITDQPKFALHYDNDDEIMENLAKKFNHEMNCRGLTSLRLQRNEKTNDSTLIRLVLCLKRSRLSADVQNTFFKLEINNSQTDNQKQHIIIFHHIQNHQLVRFQPPRLESAELIHWNTFDIICCCKKNDAQIFDHRVNDSTYQQLQQLLQPL